MREKEWWEKERKRQKKNTFKDIDKRETERQLKKKKEKWSIKTLSKTNINMLGKIRGIELALVTSQFKE